MGFLGPRRSYTVCYCKNTVTPQRNNISLAAKCYMLTLALRSVRDWHMLITMVKPLCTVITQHGFQVAPHVRGTCRPFTVFTLLKSRLLQRAHIKQDNIPNRAIYSWREQGAMGVWWVCFDFTFGFKLTWSRYMACILDAGNWEELAFCGFAHSQVFFLLLIPQ